MSASASSDDIRSNGQKPVLASQRAKEQASQSQGRMGMWFPLDNREAFSQWWANISPADAEHKVMSYVPYLKKAPTHTKSGTTPASADGSAAKIDTSQPNAVTKTQSGADPYGPRIWTSSLVSLSGKNRAINEFSIEREGEKIDENLVILHGYGAGLGFFFKNFEGLSRVPGWKIYALDMLGMGRSSRPSFKIRAKDQAGKIAETESFFIDALEEWRIVRNIEKFTLIGHSMGGYMATAYALKYPGHLDKLILASPVGIPEDPDAVSAEMPEPQESTMANEFTQDQEGATRTGRASSLKSNSKSNQEKAPKRKYPFWLTYLWDANISPFSIVRWSGPFGPRLVSGWTSRRFSHLPLDESQAMHEYSYSLFKQRGSGEFALAYILAPGALARSPLIWRIQGIGRQYIKPPSSVPSKSDSKSSKQNSTSDLSTTSDPSFRPKRETGYPVILMYGENDWMDVGAGLAAEQKMNEERKKVFADPKTTDEERRNENGRAEVVIIQKAGHHLYLEGWEQFNEVIRKEMKDVQKMKKKMMGR